MLCFVCVCFVVKAVCGVWCDDDCVLKGAMTVELLLLSEERKREKRGEEWSVML